MIARTAATRIGTHRASAAGQWQVVAQLGAELQARRVARSASTNVVPLDPSKPPVPTSDMYLAGRGVSVDEERGRTLAQRGCKLGDDTACTTYGSALATGIGGHKDTVKAAKLLEAPCSAGKPRACAMLGSIYHFGDGSPRNKKRAIELLRIGCERGGDLCGVLGAILCPSVDHPDDDCRPAIDPLRRACEQKEGEVCDLAGMLLGKGWARVDRDPTEAVRLFTIGCEAGTPSACSHLGEMMVYGDGVRQDVPWA